MRAQVTAIKFRNYRSSVSRNLQLKSHGLPLEEALKRSHIELEIGCGVGWHPIEVAKSLVPEQQSILAIERTTNKFNAFRRRLENHPDLNSVLTAIQADAFHLITELIPHESLTRLWMLYPNPEIKRPNNRWYNSSAFRMALRALRTGGTFHFATNLSDYAEESETLAPRMGLRVIEKRQISNQFNVDFSPRTHFEKKYFERGNLLFDYVFEKTDEAL